MTPDFSPRMLRLFLWARIGFAVEMAGAGKKASTTAECRMWFRKAAKVSKDELALALAGRLNDTAARLRLWRVIDLDPADFGVRLINGGRQEAVS